MSLDRHIMLDPRLSVIAKLVGTCNCCADVGCDHGRLGAFLLQSGQCERVELTDISEDSLKKARRLIALTGLQDRVRFGVGDGANAIEGTPDAVVIAGMGGSTISHIVRTGLQRLGNARLVLEPNVGAPELRKTLMECGYAIYDERVVKDGRRNYVIIAARRDRVEYDERQLIVGPVLLENMSSELLPLAEFRIRVAKKACAGARNGGDSEQVQTLEREIAIWEEARECLLRSERS